MAETIKSLADLLTQYADNTAANIGAEDLRDYVVSHLGSYGGLGVAAASSQAISGTYAVMTAWDTDEASSTDVTPSNSGNTITVTVAGVYEVHIDFDIDDDLSNTFTVALHVGGTEKEEVSLTRRVASAQVADVSCSNLITLAASDVLDVRVKSDDTPLMTVSTGQFWIRRVG